MKRKFLELESDIKKELLFTFFDTLKLAEFVFNKSIELAPYTGNKPDEQRKLAE